MRCRVRRAWSGAGPRAMVMLARDEQVTTLNLKVVQTDVDRGLILVEGAGPGAKGGWITVRDAVKKSLPKDAPKPGKFRLWDRLPEVAGGQE